MFINKWVYFASDPVETLVELLLAYSTSPVAVSVSARRYTPCSQCPDLFLFGFSKYPDAKLLSFTKKWLRGVDKGLCK